MAITSPTINLTISGTAPNEVTTEEALVAAIEGGFDFLIGQLGEAAELNVDEVEALILSVAQAGALEGTLSQSPNLFDKADPDYIDDRVVIPANGALNVNSAYAASGFIPVVAGAEYYLSSKTFIAWYNASKVFISGSSDSDATKVQTAPAGAAFLRVSLFINGGDNPDFFYVVAGDQPLDVYQPFGGVFERDARRLPDDFLPARAAEFLQLGDNLFNKATVTLGTGQTSSNPFAIGAYDLSDYIDVEEGVTYQYRSAAGGALYRACFDASNRNVTAQASAVETTSYTVPIGSGVRRMRLTIAKTRLDDFKVEAAASPTPWTAWGYRLTDEVFVPDPTSVASTWSGAKASTYGDSLVAQQEWQGKVTTQLGWIHTSYGVGGALISGASGLCQLDKINTIPADSDLVLVLAGINDWFGAVAFGAITSTTTTEFYGALNVMSERLTTRLPNARILYMTPPYCENSGNSPVNGGGLDIRDYAECVRVAARRWGFPIIDLAECGWNEVNLADYMKAEANLVHPNSTLGGSRVAEVVIGRLRALQPLP